MKDKKETSKYHCEFCDREFIKETSMVRHLCETKRRWNDKDNKSNIVAYQIWLEFYKKNTTSKKKKTYIDFIKSAYYTAFMKFANYCINVNVINISRFADYLLKNNISVDVWGTDKHYTNFLISYLREEDAMDAIARSIETAIELSKADKIQGKDCFRYGNKNKICYQITTGKISPWILYQSVSGQKFLDSLDPTQVKMIIDYINPELWAIKFKKQKDIVEQVKELLVAGGY